MREENIKSTSFVLDIKLKYKSKRRILYWVDIKELDRVPNIKYH